MAVTRTRNRIAKKKVSSSITLNLQPRDPNVKMMDLTWLIYGERKIGKTSLLSHFPKAYFFMFEPGDKALSIASNRVTQWNEFISLIEQLKKEKQVSTTVIDTGEGCYDSCFEYTCEDLSISHPTEMGYGKAWKAIEQNFTKAHIDLMSQNKGFVVTAHSQVAERETRSGEKFDQNIPSLSKAADKFYAGIIDNICYYHYIGSKRWLQIRGDDYVIAGTRCEQNFLTPSGEQIYRIPMGNSSTEAYKNLCNAFNNKQEKAFKDPDECNEVIEKSTVKRRKRTRT